MIHADARKLGGGFPSQEALGVRSVQGRQRLKVLVRRAVGRREIQPLVGVLHAASLVGMNIGAHEVSSSGEGVVLRFLRRRFPGAPIVVLDVGANDGNYARLVLKAFGPSVQLHCLEPSPTAFRGLIEGLGSQPGVKVHNVGLSDVDGEAELYAPSAGSPLGSTYRRDLSHVGMAIASTERCQLERLTTFVNREGLGTIHLLKLDVEGHELAVLRGCGDLLSSGAVKLVQFEFGGANIDSGTYLRDFFRLLEPSFQLYRVLQNGLMPMRRYREADEIFLTTNYLAEWRGSPGSVTPAVAATDRTDHAEHS